MSFMGNLLSAGANLLGGYFNNQNQNKINNQNIQEAQWSAEGGYLPGLVQNAKNAGLNPLAVLGQNAPSMPVAVGSSPGDSVAKSGQDVGRAVAALSDTSSKTDALNQELLRAKIDNTNADTAATMARNSQVARNLGQPGTPPSFPLPRPDPRYTTSIEPATSRFLMPDGSIAFEPSKAYTESTFGTAPFAKMRAGGIEMQDVTRPDVVRSIENLQLPSWAVLPQDRMEGGD